jgi:hypothetical protein
LAFVRADDFSDFSDDLAKPDAANHYAAAISSSSAADDAAPKEIL